MIDITNPHFHFRQLQLLFPSPHILLGIWTNSSILYKFYRRAWNISTILFHIHTHSFSFFFFSFFACPLAPHDGNSQSYSISDTHKQPHSCLFVSSWTLSRASQPCRMAFFYEGNLHKQLATGSLKHETGGNTFPPSHRFNSFYYIIVIRIGLRPICCKQRITL